jgi:hypothetical protein
MGWVSKPDDIPRALVVRRVVGGRARVRAGALNLTDETRQC